MTDEDLERFAEQLSLILEQFEVLDRADTSDIPPTAQTFDMHSVFRDDAPARPCRKTTPCSMPPGGKSNTSGSRRSLKSSAAGLGR